LQAFAGTVAELSQPRLLPLLLLLALLWQVLGVKAVLLLLLMQEQLGLLLLLGLLQPALLVLPDVPVSFGLLLSVARSF
jgi:hypothetical protein